MIRTLCFTAVLLAPGIAYAANQSVTSPPFSASVVGAGSDPIACDYGAPYTGAIPAGAAAAGFTHCAVNLDFTQSYFSNVANFIDCFNGNTPSLLNKDSGSGFPCDSNHFAIVSDGGIPQVFALSMLPSDYNGGLTGNNLISVTSYDSVFPGYPTANWTLPNGFFVEQTWRLNTDAPYTNGNFLTYAPFQYSYPNNNDGFFECDWAEIGSAPGGGVNPAACGQRNPSTYPSGLPVGTPYDPTNYHTYGMRFTTDGSANQAACNYYSASVVQGLPSSSFLSCDTIPVTNPPGLYTSRTMSSLVIGPEGALPSGSTMTSNLTVYIQRITIWECSGWLDDHSNVHQSAAQCNGPVLTTGP